MFMPSQFEIQSELTDQGATVSISGELDLATVPRLRQEIQTTLKQGTSQIVLELSNLTFIDSSGLGLLIELNNRSLNEDWELRLTRPPARAFSVFSITGVDANLPFIDESSSK